MHKLLDPKSKHPFYAMEHNELNSMPLSILPIRWNTITKSISQNRYGVTILTTEKTPILLSDTTIDEFLGTALKQKLLPQKEAQLAHKLNHELTITMTDAHFYATLQNNDPINPWHTVFDFQPEQLSGLFSTQPCELYNFRNFKGYHLNNLKKNSIKRDNPAIKEIVKVFSQDFSFSLMFKLTDDQFNVVFSKIQDINLECKTGMTQYKLISKPTDQHTLNCFASIEYLTKAAGITDSFFNHIPDTILLSNNEVLPDYPYLYKYREKITLLEKLKLSYLENTSTSIVLGLSMLSSFLYSSKDTNVKETTGMEGQTKTIKKYDFLLAECKQEESSNLKLCILYKNSLFTDIYLNAEGNYIAQNPTPIEKWEYTSAGKVITRTSLLEFVTPNQQHLLDKKLLCMGEDSSSLCIDETIEIL